MTVVDHIINAAALENSEGQDPEDGQQGAEQNQSSQNQNLQAGDDTGHQVSQSGADQSGKATVPEDHPTKLGRRVSRMEERMESMFEKLDSFMTDSRVRTQGVERDEFANPYYSPEDGTPDHIKEAVVAVKRELAQEAHQAEEAQQKYAEKYIREVQKGFGDVEEELHNAVVKELLHTNFQAYGKHTGKPEQDAKLNYEAAVGIVLRRQRTGAARPAPNVRGDQQSAPTDLSSAGHLGPPAVKKVELDEFSKKFLQAVGAKEDDDWVLESLGVKK